MLFRSRRSPGDASREEAVGSLRQSAPCADDREGPSVPRPARAALRGASEASASGRRTASTASREPREDTTGSNATEARGSKDATRLSSVREIFDFPRAVRTLRVLTTLPDDVRQAASIRRILAPLRESVALSRTTASPGQRGDGVASGRASGSEAREQQPGAPRAFWISQSLSEHYRDRGANT